MNKSANSKDIVAKHMKDMTFLNSVTFWKHAVISHFQFLFISVQYKSKSMDMCNPSWYTSSLNWPRREKYFTK